MNNLLKLRNVVLLAVIIIGINSCKKKETTPTVVTACFEETYNGTYNGTGSVNGLPYMGDLTITKTGCETAHVVTGNSTDDLSSLTVSAAGGYTGKTSTGADATLALNGNSISVTIGTTISFNGTKP